MTAAYMNAARLHALGDTAALVYEQVPIPQPGRGEVLVQVHAAAITRDELEWPEGRLPAIPSYEFSGVVSAIGVGVESLAIADQVYALSSFDRDGAAAEYIAVPAAHVAPKPRTLGHAEAAALPLAGLSAWQGLFDHGQLQSGQRVLIHGATGGVGSLAVQLARAYGAHVVATTSTPSVDTALALGAHEAIDHTTTRFEEAIEPVDLVFDTVGGERLRRSPAVLTPGGRLVSIAEAPPDAPTRSQITTTYFVVEPNQAQLEELTNLADQGQLRPVIEELFPLTDAKEAFQRLTQPHRHGKVVLRIFANDRPDSESARPARGQQRAA